jgi:hypothetical protein
MGRTGLFIADALASGLLGKRVRRRFIAAASVGVVSALVLAVPATAATQKEKISDAQFTAIVDHAWSTGKVTDAERAAVLTRPDLAATTIDPTSAKADYELPGWVGDSDEVGVHPAPSRTNDAQVALATTSTSSRDRYIVYENWLHSKLLDYHFVVAWSYNGSSVVGSPSSYTYVKNCAGTCQNFGIVSNDQYPDYGGGRIYAWTVPLRAKFIYGKAGSTEAPKQPTVRFGVYYNGTYNYVVLSKE